MNGVVKSAGQSTENYDLVLHLMCGSEPSGVMIGGIYPVRLGFKVGEARNTFHKIG